MIAFEPFRWPSTPLCSCSAKLTDQKSRKQGTENANLQIYSVSALKRNANWIFSGKKLGVCESVHFLMHVCRAYDVKGTESLSGCEAHPNLSGGQEGITRGRRGDSPNRKCLPCDRKWHRGRGCLRISVAPIICTQPLRVIDWRNDGLCKQTFTRKRRFTDTFFPTSVHYEFARLIFHLLWSTPRQVVRTNRSMELHHLRDTKH